MSLPLRLHHLFCFVAPDPPDPPGLAPTFRRAHPGQGTANVCYMFGDAYLELLWETDRAEITAPDVARTRLAERARWRETGACPFGLCVTTDGPPPFRTWDYAPPFLPPGMSIPVATLSEDPLQPFVFLPPAAGQPAEAWQPGLGRIVGLHLDRPPHVPPAADLRILAALGLLTLGTAEEWRLVLTVENTHGGPPGRLALPALDWTSQPF